jgi:GNAT superfamily N-acetyltransferase
VARKLASARTYACPMTNRPTAPVLIRVARSEDIPELVDLLIQGSLVDGKEDPLKVGQYQQALAEIEATPDSDLFVAEIEGAVVGVCQLIVFRHFQSIGGLCAEIESVHVSPDWRGRGIGGLLLDGAVSRAADSGCYRVQLMSNKKRHDAHRFYGRHGFVKSHEGFKLGL